jgi:hypothetical protein
LAFGCWQLAISCWLLAVGLLAVGITSGWWLVVGGLKLKLKLKNEE